MELPDDVILDILSRLPFDAVGKIRALSKSHNQATYTSYFKALAAGHQPLLLGFLLQSLRTTATGRRHVLSFATPRPNSPPLELSLSFLPGQTPQVLAVAPNGLVLFQSRHRTRHQRQLYTICKLPTKQWQRIPIPKTRFFTLNIAMYVTRSNPLHFKIIRLCRDTTFSKRRRSFCYTVCELFDSESWRWKRLEDLVHDNSLSFVEPFCVAVVVGGLAHWQFFDEKSILAFDFLSETWSSFAAPEAITVEQEARERTEPFKSWHTKLVEYKGKLGLIREFSEPAAARNELWVMEDYKERVWTKKWEFLVSNPTAVYGSDTLMAMENNEKVKFCNVETGNYSYRQLEPTHYYGSVLKVFPFSSDFEPWDYYPPPPRSPNPPTVAELLRPSPPDNSK
ncbi:F-box protein At5g49610-like [Cucurbita moschata]|uniref:F-box protein At5g49610-like n=1 Tax=Cucurbita moschata TaxID=3662 RepID=A0A6J1F395_CUCMO|nr:F-box protein At5g49610-like [Cucurbita moschata]